MNLGGFRNGVCLSEEISFRRSSTITNKAVSDQRAPHCPNASHRRRGDERPLRRVQVCLGLSHQVQMRLDIHVKTPIPIVVVDIVVDIREVPQPRPSMIGKDDVQTAHFRDGHVDQPRNFGALRDVCFDGKELFLFASVVSGKQTGDFVEVLDEGVGAVTVGSVVDDDAHLEMGKGSRGGRPQACRAGGDQGH